MENKWAYWDSGFTGRSLLPREQDVAMLRPLFRRLPSAFTLLDRLPGLRDRLPGFGPRPAAGPA
jgi:hypothetical protein